MPSLKPPCPRGFALPTPNRPLDRSPTTQRLSIPIGQPAGEEIRFTTFLVSNLWCTSFPITFTYPFYLPSCPQAPVFLTTVPHRRRATCRPPSPSLPPPTAPPSPRQPMFPSPPTPTTQTAASRMCHSSTGARYLARPTTRPTPLRPASPRSEERRAGKECRSR